jgi:hypothetical protein
MPHENQSRETTFGYLSVVHSAEHGYFGGYLIISELGRPLEFHCTSPVRPSRAQEILYGPTLQPYLVGEQIAAALLKAAKLTPRLVLTDQAAMLAARRCVEVPVALVVARREASSSGTAVEVLHGEIDRIHAGEYELQLPLGFEAEREAVLQGIALVSQRVDLSEPFGRIHEAIREAQRIGGRTVESHGQAA